MVKPILTSKCSVAPLFDKLGRQICCRKKMMRVGVQEECLHYSDHNCEKNYCGHEREEKPKGGVLTELLAMMEVPNKRDWVW